jgi:hypothetical protein
MHRNRSFNVWGEEFLTTNLFEEGCELLRKSL